MGRRQQTIFERRLVRLAHMHLWASLTVGKVAIQEIAEGVNKMKRSFLCSSGSLVAEAETPRRWRITKKYPTVAFTAKSVRKPQHRIWSLSQGHSHLVY